MEDYLKNRLKDHDNLRDTVRHIMSMIINDADFASGGIPDMDKTLQEDYNFTSIQAADVQVRLYKIHQYIEKTLKAKIK